MVYPHQTVLLHFKDNLEYYYGIYFMLPEANHLLLAINLITHKINKSIILIKVLEMVIQISFNSGEPGIKRCSSHHSIKRKCKRSKQIVLLGFGISV